MLATHALLKYLISVVPLVGHSRILRGMYSPPMEALFEGHPYSRGNLYMFLV